MERGVGVANGQIVQRNALCINNKRSARLLGIQYGSGLPDYRQTIGCYCTKTTAGLRQKGVGSQHNRICRSGHTERTLEVLKRPRRATRCWAEAIEGVAACGIVHIPCGGQAGFGERNHQQYEHNTQELHAAKLRPSLKGWALIRLMYD